MELSEAVFNLAEDINKLAYQSRDNLFSANHRNAMIRQHGATSAQWITIEELLKN